MHATHGRQRILALVLLHGACLPALSAAGRATMMRGVTCSGCTQHAKLLHTVCIGKLRLSAFSLHPSWTAGLHDAAHSVVQRAGPVHSACLQNQFEYMLLAQVLVKSMESPTWRFHSGCGVGQFWFGTHSTDTNVLCGTDAWRLSPASSVVQWCSAPQLVIEQMNCIPSLEGRCHGVERRLFCGITQQVESGVEDSA
jgi:hypothetical protein